MLRSGGPDERTDPDCPPARGTVGDATMRVGPDDAGIAPVGDNCRDPAGTTAGSAERLPGIPGAGGILPAGEASVEGMGWPVVGHTRTQTS
jgi:hypothetical protein